MYYLYNLPKKNAYYATAFFYGLAIKLLRLPSCIRSTMYCLNPDCGVPFNTSRLVLTMPVVLSTIELIALWDSMSVLHFQQMQCSCMTDFFKCLQKSNWGKRFTSLYKCSLSFPLNSTFVPNENMWNLDKVSNSGGNWFQNRSLIKTNKFLQFFQTVFSYTSQCRTSLWGSTFNQTFS